MKHSEARNLLRKDIKAMTLEQVQRHRVRLIDAWRHSKAEYGFEVAVKEGFYLIVADPGASGFSPRDIWLTHQLLSRLEETEAYEQKLFYEQED